MKRLFIVIAKLFGLIQLSRMLIVLFQIVPQLGFFAVSGGEDEGDVFFRLYSLSGSLAYFVMSGALAWLLLARTEWLANRCRIPDDNGEALPGAGTLLRVGTILVGVYVTVHAFPKLGREISNMFFYMSDMRPHQYIIDIEALPAAIELALGLYLALRSDHVLRLIDKFQKGPTETATSASE